MIDGQVGAVVFWSLGTAAYAWAMHQDVAHSGLSAGDLDD